VFQIFSSESSEVAALQTGQIDGIEGLSNESAAALGADYNVSTGYQGALTWEMRINTNDAPLNNLDLRQAMMYAIDRQAIVSDVLFGFSSPAYSPFGSGSPVTNPAWATEFAYNPSKAKQLVASSGVANPTATLLYSTGIPPMAQICQVLQANLDAVGFKVTLDPVDSTAYASQTQTGDWQLLMSASAGANKYPTGVTENSIYRTTDNPGWPGGVPPAAYVDAINTLNSTVAPTQADFTALGNVLVNDPWTVSIARWDTIFAFSKSVSGFDYTVDDEPVFENARIS
jgi:peptide/nickel transport system substrate-binding protein